MKIRVIQGPNINMLGKRDPSIYGVMSMDDIHDNMKKVADAAGHEIEFFKAITKARLSIKSKNA